MFEWVKARVLRLMRVPHEPEPPMGAPGSARVFRAGVNHYRLRVLRWYFGQAGALIGIGGASQSRQQSINGLGRAVGCA